MENRRKYPRFIGPFSKGQFFSWLFLSISLVLLFAFYFKVLPDEMPHGIKEGPPLIAMAVIILISIVVEVKIDGKYDSNKKASMNSEDMPESHQSGEGLQRENPLYENQKTVKKRYPRDQSQPYGSKENPIIVGIPDQSDVLVYDKEKDQWLLTDGLGNGWIR